MYFVFLLSLYTNSSESLELEKAVETLLRLVFPQHFSFSQTSTLFDLFCLFDVEFVQQSTFVFITLE